ncbi:alpha/beta hydrolase [Thioclava indica]|uniref:Uncharacterized protein n=1 Tax=Thioclava indica TaxID=1353528 RepID=A0A074JUI3_9RHOB|nr:alpha/beta fold hydrolase [Thioclava indica]KEO61351.1 hypothetical protein DT23_09675 [Thioclava indica]
MLRVMIVMVLVVLSGCAPRGRLAYLAQPSPEARTIFVGSTRAPDPETRQPFGTARSFDLRLAKFDVATPPDHQTGTIDYPKNGQPADPQTQFMVSSAQIDMPQNAFRRDLRAALVRQNGQAVVFVHGFNNDFSEGLYRSAQLGADFDLPGVLVHYSWPSRAHVLGYAYDRDSVLFARDGLSKLLTDLQAAGARQILLIGHSLGAQLSMEVLRQEALAHNKGLFDRISGVVLISPDIAVEVFESQADAIGALPQPFVIFTSQRDRALQLSARLSGQEDRLGDLKDFKRVARYRVTVVDVGAFSVGDGHFDLAQSPALIKLLDRAGQVAQVLTGEQTGRTSLASAVILTVDNATQIVLNPLSGG